MWINAAVLAATFLFAVAEQEDHIPWYVAVSEFHFPQLFALDLAGDTFSSSIRHSTADYVMVDFYAPWCPHCQHFAPDYERLALAIRRANDGACKARPGKLLRVISPGHTANFSGNACRRPRILAAVLDCVRYASSCQKFGIDSFPTLLWGRKSDWLDKDDEFENLLSIDVWPRSAEAVASWIRNKSSVDVDPSRVSKDEVVRLLHRGQYSGPLRAKGTVSSSVGSQLVKAADVWDVQVGVALLLHYAFQKTFKTEGTEDTPKRALLRFVALLARRFPESQRHKGSVCRQSLAALHDQLQSNWTGLVDSVGQDSSGQPIFRIDSGRLEQEWRLCGTEWDKYREGFHSCRGSWPGKRGFTCGLWETFHMLAARSPDRDAQRDLGTVRGAIRHFFDCQDCRRHFFQIPVGDSDVKTQRAVQLWWWNAHNVVNRRVGKLEMFYQDGDPEYPKVQWPSKNECPDCRRVGGRAPVALGVSTLRGNPVATSLEKNDVPVEFPTLADAVAQEGWNLTEVFALLDRTYGGG